MLLFRRAPVVIRPRSQHSISRQDIDPDALKVLYRLSEAGHKAYLVGGGVRDLLLGCKPKDFDIGTDAHPQEIRRLFRNCFLVGRRFRLAHVVFGGKAIETSTFRKQPPLEAADEGVPGGLYQSSDNTFGSPEEDAKRRDFTVNGLFYDIKTFNVIDYVGGLRDLDRRVLRCIGDPNVRFREDPVRMLRAVRLSARLGLRMDWSTRRAIRRHYAEIVHAAVPRVMEEILKLFTHASAAPAFRLLWETRMMATLLPEVDGFVNGSGRGASPLWALLKALDAAAEKHDHSAGLRLAVLLYPLFRERQAEGVMKGGSHASHLHAAEAALAPLATRLHLPKAIHYHAIHVLDAQQRLDARPLPGRRVRFGHPEVFADALLLCRIRHIAAGKHPEHLEEWERLQRSLPRHEPRHERPGRSAQPHAPDAGRGRHAGPDDGRDRDAGPDEAPDAGDEAVAADGPADAAAAPGVAGEGAPRKRRRRGGRRRRRGPAPDQAGGAAPA